DSAGTLTGVDPLLGPLQFNGGPTPTHALLPGSPAIDRGLNPPRPAFHPRGPRLAPAPGAPPGIGPLPADSPPPTPVRIVAVPSRKRGVARVRVKDAATGAVRAVLTPFPGFRGRLRLQLVDVTGDGALDLIVRAVGRGKRRQRVYDAVTLAPLP